MAKKMFSQKSHSLEIKFFIFKIQFFSLNSINRIFFSKSIFKITLSSYFIQRKCKTQWWVWQEQMKILLNSKFGCSISFFKVLSF